MRFTAANAFALLLTPVTASQVIHELNSTTIDNFLAEHPRTLLSFITPWCQACKDYKIELQAVATSTNLLDVSLATVDCDVEKDVCQQYGVPVYPTILMVDGDEFVRYQGRREQSAITSLVERYDRPLVTSISSTAASEEFKKLDKATVVGYLNDVTAREVFRATADKFRDQYSFALASDDLYASSDMTHETAVLVHSSSPAREAWYNSTISATTLEDFIILNSVPSLGLYGKDIEHNDPVFGKHLPLAAFLTADPEDQTRLSSHFSPLAERTRGQVLWVTAEPKDFSGLLGKLSLDADKGPYLVISRRDPELRYVYPVQGYVQGLIDEEAGISGVIDELLAGELVSSSSRQEGVSVPAAEAEAASEGADAGISAQAEQQGPHEEL